MSNLIITEVNGPYQLNHFIYLAIAVLIIVGSLIIYKKLHLQLRTVLIIMIIVSICSELIKICYYVEPVYNETGSLIRAYLPKTALPFHMCSIQIFIMAIVFFSKNEKLQRFLYAFIYPTASLGATMSLLIPTIDVEFTSLLTYQYFFYHAFLISFGLYVFISKEVVINTRTYRNSCITLLVLFLGSIWINSLLSEPGIDFYTNFFYSSKPPISGLPLLNLNHGWFVYIIVMMSVGIILMTLLHLPFIIKDFRNKKKGIVNE